MRTLVVGASGYLGGEVARRAAAAGHEVTGTGSARLDVTDRAAVLAFVAAVRPALVVNCAARADDWAVCADGAAHVALAAAAAGARLVHVSSDALHAGRAEPYPDTEPPAPVYAYGAAKAAAETAVAAIDPGAVLVRTSLIVGDGRSRHVAFCRDVAAGRRPGVLFTDEVRCPVAVTDLAAAVLELAAAGVAGPVNVAGPEAVSRAALGRLVAAADGRDPAAVPTGTLAGSGLVRPGRVVLDSSRAAAVLRTPLRPVSEVHRPHRTG